MEDSRRRSDVGSNEKEEYFKKIVLKPSYKSSELEFGVLVNIIFSSFKCCTRCISCCFIGCGG